MAVARRVSPPPAQSGGSVAFGSDGFFTGALGLPEGNYAISFNTALYQPTKQDGTPSKTPAFLAVIGTFYPIDANGNSLGEPTEHPLGCGTNAHESFLPSADGKGFDAVPNGKSAGIWNLSNFGIFFESLKSAGMPRDLVTSSFDVIDGIWCHVQNIPEPEEKKAAAKRARSKTGMAGIMGGGDQEQERDRTVLVVSEILENGRPWEGSGGIPEVGAPAAKAPAKKAAPAPAGRRPAAQTPVAAPALDEETVGNAALEAIAGVLGNAPSGMAKAKLKVDTFAAVKKSSGDDVAQLVMETYLSDDATLAAVLEQVGYKVQGLFVKPA